MSTSGSKQIHEALIGTVMAVGEDVEVRLVRAVKPLSAALHSFKCTIGTAYGYDLATCTQLAPPHMQ